jgi:hypothetical protein
MALVSPGQSPRHSPVDGTFPRYPVVWIEAPTGRGKMKVRRANSEASRALSYHFSRQRLSNKSPCVAANSAHVTSGLAAHRSATRERNAAVIVMLYLSGVPCRLHMRRSAVAKRASAALNA